jgi:hypothetical protein
MRDAEQDLTGDASYVNVPPDASAMVESMRAYGYTLATAVADLVDNSIAANCRNVWLRFVWEGQSSWIAVTDDGDGMSEAGLTDAMRLGSKNPREARALSDLGRFGLGLKTASFSQARRLTVISRCDPGHSAVRRWDLDHLAREDVTGWQLLCAVHPDAGERANELDRLKVATGTEVLLEVLDRVIGSADGGDVGVTAEDHFVSEIARVREHLEMVFHRFLARIGNRRLTIAINGEPISPWDPFLIDHQATRCVADECFPAERTTERHAGVRLRGFVLPHRDRFDESHGVAAAEAHRRSGGPNGWNAQQGFYLYRNERLIIAGDWLGLGVGQNGWKKEEHYKLARIQVDIPNSTDEDWQIDVKKSAALAPPALRLWLRGLAKTVRESAKDVYSHRGAYGPRAPHPANAHEYPWICRRYDGDAFSYRIDRRNPVLGALIGSLPAESAKQLETLLRLVEETVPVQRIWIDTASNQDAVARPFEGAQVDELKSHIKIAHRALIRGGFTQVAAWTAIRTFPAFAVGDAPALIAVLAEEGEE